MANSFVQILAVSALCIIGIVLLVRMTYLDRRDSKQAFENWGLASAPVQVMKEQLDNAKDGDSRMQAFTVDGRTMYTTIAQKKKDMKHIRGMQVQEDDEAFVQAKHEMDMKARQDQWDKARDFDNTTVEIGLDGIRHVNRTALGSYKDNERNTVDQLNSQSQTQKTIIESQEACLNEAVDAQEKKDEARRIEGEKRSKKEAEAALAEKAKQEHEGKKDEGKNWGAVVDFFLPGSSMWGMSLEEKQKVKVR